LGVQGLLPLLTKSTSRESLAPTAFLFKSARALAQNPRYPLGAHTLSPKESFGPGVPVSAEGGSASG
jgi:hypothetical protein